MNPKLALGTLPLIVTLSACGHAAGTGPHEMSASQHEAAAAREDQAAAEHAGQYSSGAKEQTRESCSGGKGRVCWTVTTNPTAAHVKTAAEHRELAAQHRAASQALKDAEGRACAGLDSDDRDMSPFAHTADIASVSELREEKTTVGATVVLRAAPGLTEELLKQIVSCHLARNAAVGHDMSEMQYCPLVPRSAQATVRSVGEGFAVDIKGGDAAAAAEIWRRAQQLAPR